MILNFLPKVKLNLVGMNLSNCVKSFFVWTGRWCRVIFYY